MTGPFSERAPSPSTVMAAIVLGLSSGLAHGLRAQVAWDTPLLVHPFVTPGWSVFVADVHLGDGVAAIGGWRGDLSGTEVGIRAGLGDGLGDDLAVFGGVDVSGRIVTASSEEEPAVGWVLGAGLSVSNDVLISIPAAIVVGWDIPLEGANLQPHAGPRVVLDAGDHGPGEDDIELDVVADLGVDLVFDAGWALRFGGTLGDRDGAAIGVQFPLGAR